MKDEVRLDCTWCGSAKSIEFGVCQICLMEYPLETKVIRLPLERSEKRSVVIPVEDELAEKQPS